VYHSTTATEKIVNSLLLTDTTVDWTDTSEDETEGARDGKHPTTLITLLYFYFTFLRKCWDGDHLQFGEVFYFIHIHPSFGKGKGKK